MTKIIQKIKDNKVEAVFIFVVIVIFLFLTFDVNGQEKQIEPKSKTEEKENNKISKETKVKVDIKGAVNTPGVFEMNKTDRVIDVINKAGGLKENADTSLINLSKKVSDEMVITIYTKEELTKQNQVCPPCECPEVNDDCIEKEESATSSKEKETKSEEKTLTGKISINTASLEELQLLDGIGETKAKAIIGYRNTNGKFKNIEEIQNVSGIGEATYEKIKDDITI